MERLGHGWVQGTYAPLPTSAGYLKRRRAYVGSSDHDPWSTRALMTIDRHLPDTLTVRLDYTTKPPKADSSNLVITKQSQSDLQEALSLHSTDHFERPHFFSDRAPSNQHTTSLTTSELQYTLLPLISLEPMELALQETRSGKAMGMYGERNARKGSGKKRPLGTTNPSRPPMPLPAARNLLPESALHPSLPTVPNREFHSQFSSLLAFFVSRTLRHKRGNTCSTLGPTSAERTPPPPPHT
ncbi:hypothetical protein FA13DRAFT_1840047 [Coprinellus micaceus]|uniref:Uncharacterized protein n=1 Tax=Coprinellus micaceus TaxID=71717 RepID=A0A4Y7SEW5_COPMI|nr:hypothetical protein FA13DRAFT_1840047 [Coprinellus micaceus]